MTASAHRIKLSTFLIEADLMSASLTLTPRPVIPMWFACGVELEGSVIAINIGMALIRAALHRTILSQTVVAF